MKICIGILTVFLYFNAIKADDLGVVKISPDSKERLVKIGDSLSASCFVMVDSNEKDTLKWDKPSDVDLTSNTRKVTLEKGRMKVYANLTITNVKESQLGIYTCKFKSSSASFEIKGVKEEKTQTNFTYNDGKTAVLSCNLTDVDPARIKKVEWLKNDTLVSKLSDKNRFKEDEENRTLTITGARREDADLYIARFRFKDSTYDCDVPLSATPLVLDFDKSKNLIEDDDMELQCKVKGYPRAVVQWLKDDKVLNATDGKRIILSPLDGYKNARLVIKSVQFDDAGDYTCKAYSAYFNVSDSKSLVVRVKDKLAALWPFLGIVGEVVILCTIIFIYEKRRNKQAESEANNAEDIDSSSLKKEGVRHRGQKK